MPQLDGIEATRRIVAALGDDVRVLMLTTFGLDDYVFDALRAGASGFMLKDAPPEELLDAIRVVAGGSALLAPSVTRAVVAEFARRSPATAAETSPRLAELTEREREVLMLLTRGRSNAEIAADLVVSEATVKTHVAHVLMKLGVRDRVQAVIFAYEAGLVSADRELIRAARGSAAAPRRRRRVPLVSRITGPMIAPIALSLPVADLLHGVGVVGHRLVHDLGQLVAAGAAQALGLDDRRGVAALGHQLRQHLLGRRAGHLALAHHRHQLRQRRRLQLASAAGSSSPTRATSSPVTQLAIARGSAPSAATAASKKSPELGAEGQQLGGVGRQAQLALEAARRAAAGSSGSAARARSSISSVGAIGTRSGSGK